MPEPDLARHGTYDTPEEVSERVHAIPSSRMMWLEVAQHIITDEVICNPIVPAAKGNYTHTHEKLRT